MVTVQLVADSINARISINLHRLVVVALHKFKVGGSQLFLRKNEEVEGKVWWTRGAPQNHSECCESEGLISSDARIQGRLQKHLGVVEQAFPPSYLNMRLSSEH
jgi:hypothetical protein